jgi:hypothetical protein
VGASWDPKEIFSGDKKKVSCFGKKLAPSPASAAGKGIDKAKSWLPNKMNPQRMCHMPALQMQRKKFDKKVGYN